MFFLLSVIPDSSLRFGPPRRYSKAFDQWLLINGNDAKAKQVDIFPSITFEAVKAVYVTQEIPKNLADRAHITLQKQFVAEIPNGRAVGKEPFIITGDDTIMGDLSMIFSPYYHDIFFTAKLPKCVKISGPVLVLAGAPGSNFGHWLHQMLPRLELAYQAGWKTQDFEKVLINSTSNNFAIESLLAVGFNKNQFVETFSEMHLQSSNLIVPSIPEAGNPPEWITSFLRSAYGTPVSKPRRRIYTSRANSRWRRIINEEELYPVLTSFGFDIIFPESLSFIDGVRLFEDSEAVCGMHGANLANICFCKPGAKLIEIYHPQHPEIYYWVTATGAQLNYSFLLGEGEIRDYPENHNHGSFNRLDTIVCPKKLRKTLIASGL